MSLTCSVEFKYFQIARNQWHGEYLEIGFDNKARIHCDFKEYDYSIGNPIDPALVGYMDVTKSCNLEKPASTLSPTGQFLIARSIQLICSSKGCVSKSLFDFSISC